VVVAEVDSAISLKEDGRTLAATAGLDFELTHDGFDKPMRFQVSEAPSCRCNPN
jgi:hypothetical protein